MAHAHSQGTDLTPAEINRHRRALRIMVVVLIPLGIWTLAGLIAFWPGDVSEHISQESAGYTVAGADENRRILPQL